MINFKKIDDQDIIFVNKSLTAREEKEFSDFLKARKLSSKLKRGSHNIKRPKKELA